MKANLDKNLAPAWVSGKSYSTGEFCLCNKRLYICIEDNSDTEFDNSKWEIRNLVDLVSGINSNLGDNNLLFTRSGFENGKVSTYTADSACKKILVIAQDFNESQGANTGLSIITNGNATVTTVRASGQMNGDGAKYARYSLFLVENISKGETLTLTGNVHPIFIGVDISNKNYDYQYIDNGKAFNQKHEYSATKPSQVYVVTFVSNSNSSYGFSYVTSNVDIVTNTFRRVSGNYYYASVVNFSNIKANDTITFNGYYAWNFLLVEIY